MSTPLINYPQRSNNPEFTQSVGPPSGQNPSDGLKPDGSFRNPWVVIPRPMNGFTELNPIQYERQEKEKVDLQRVLKEQMEEKKARPQEENQKKIMEELYYEQKLLKEREELSMREQMEKDLANKKIQQAQVQNQILLQEREKA